MTKAGTVRKIENVWNIIKVLESSKVHVYWPSPRARIHCRRTSSKFCSSFRFRFPESTDPRVGLWANLCLQVREQKLVRKSFRFLELTGSHFGMQLPGTKCEKCRSKDLKTFFFKELGIRRCIEEVLMTTSFHPTVGHFVSLRSESFVSCATIGHETECFLGYKPSANRRSNYSQLWITPRSRSQSKET